MLKVWWVQYLYHFNVNHPFVLFVIMNAAYHLNTTLLFTIVGRFHPFLNHEDP